MARITVYPLQIEDTRDWNNPGRRIPQPLTCNRETRTMEGAFSVVNVKIDEVRKALYRVGPWIGPNYHGNSICYMMDDAERAKFPAELPDGWEFIKSLDREGNSKWALILDGGWLESQIIRVREMDTSSDLVKHSVLPAEVVEFGVRAGSGHETSMNDHVVAVFDIADSDDCATVVHRDVLPRGDWEAAIRDSRYPWIKPRDIGYSFLTTSNDYEAAIPLLYAKWKESGARTGDYHREAMDKNLSTGSIRQARAAFALDLPAVDHGKEHRYSKRRLVLEDEVSLPFPVEFSSAFTNGKLLAFKTTPDGRYLRPTDSIYDESQVLIHRSNGYHRFLFVEHHVWQTGVAEHCAMAFILPVAVSDAECTRQAPLSPQRGMHPAVTRAIITNPFMASAMQHAFNRRKYLRSQIDWTGCPKIPGWATRQMPILARNVRGGKNLKGAHYTRIGKRTTYDGDFQCTKAIGDLVASLPENEIKFMDSLLQPVAGTDTRKTRRRVQLDL